MDYEIKLTEEAKEQLRAMPKERRRQIGQKINSLAHNLSGDVKKLTALEKKYRLRVGSYRVLFRLEENQISVYAVRDRKEAYD